MSSSSVIIVGYTCCDFKLAKLAGNKENHSLANFPKTKLTWTAKKIDLLELIYGYYCTEVINFGKVSLNQLITYYEFMYNIDLFSTNERAWCNLTIRENPTS